MAYCNLYLSWYVSKCTRSICTAELMLRCVAAVPFHVGNKYVSDHRTQRGAAGNSGAKTRRDVLVGSSGSQTLFCGVHDRWQHLCYPRSRHVDSVAVVYFSEKMFAKPFRVKSNTVIKGSDRWVSAAATVPALIAMSTAIYSCVDFPLRSHCKLQ